MDVEFIPIVLFVVLGIITLGFFYWNHKNRQSIMDTVQKAIDHGSELTPDLLAKPGAPLASARGSSPLQGSRPSTGASCC